MSVNLTEAWEKRLGEFAAAVKKDSAEITKLLTPHVGEPGDDALEVLSDAAAVPDTTIKEALQSLGIPSGVLNKHLHILRGPAPVVDEKAVTAGTGYDNILPTVPEDSTFLDSLKVGGVLKVDTTAVLSSVKAAMANKLGLYDVPGILKDRMETFSEDQSEPVGEDYFKLQKLVTSRSYAEVLSAMGIEGSFMSPAKSKAFLAKVDTYMWPALAGFQKQLQAWYDTWTAGTNPGAVLAYVMMGQSAKSGSIMPPNMINPPETSGLHDEAEAVINNVNKVFGGVGIAVAKALAYDATRIKGVLDNAGLPAATGFTTKEMMLKGLKLSVGADYVRLERNLTRYVLAIMEFPKITVPNEEYAYLAALIQLGSQISWDKLADGVGISKKL